MKKIHLLFTLFLSIHTIHSQQWFLVDSVTTPGLTPSISTGTPQSVWIVGGSDTNPKIFRSTNGGYNWAEVSVTGISYELNCVAAFNEQMAFIGEGIVNGNAKMLKTTNGGANWSIVLQTGPNQGYFTGLAFTKARTNIFGLAIAERIYRTSNSGLNWIELNSGVVGVSNAHNSLMIVDNYFYGFGLNNGTARIRVTTDNASSWLTQNISVIGNYTSGIAFHTNKLIGVASTSTSMPYISRTTDGGNTWNSLNIGTGITGNCYITWIPDGPVIYIMGENGGIKRSTNDGLTWVSMTTAGVTELKHFDFVQLNNVVYGYAVSSNGKVIKLMDTLEVLTGINSNGIKPGEFRLEQNYPNPFNPATEIVYDIAKESFVKISVYDALGREINILVNESKSSGRYNITFDGTGLNSGVYFYKMQAGDFVQTRKMILMK